MRLLARRLVVVSLAALATPACGDAPRDAGPTSLYIRAGRGVAVLEAGATAPAYKQRGALPSGDWSTMVHTDRAGDNTKVIATDPESENVLWRKTLRGRYVANAVSQDGNLVALSPAREPYYRYGRTHTTFVITGRWAGDGRLLKVSGNLEPEAFSSDGRSLFVISYLPAQSPSQYQVRRLDLTTGKLGGVFTPHDELQERMGGTARIQTASADGTRLYTLYTVKEDGVRQAFIHVLDLDEQWAHCIDLPAGFAESAESATALAVSPDGKQLYVANSQSGTIAEIDTGTMLVTRTASLDFRFTSGTTHAAIDGEGTLYVTGGPTVMAIEIASLTERDSWTMSDGVSGIQMDGPKVYVGVGKYLTILDVEAGTRRSLDVEGVGRIEQLGPIPEPVDEQPIVKCAC